MATEDISTLAIKVTGTGITDNTTKLDKLADAADKAEKAVKRLGTNVVQTNMSGAAGGTTALANAMILLNSTVNTLITRTNMSTTAIRTNTTAMNAAHSAVRGLTGSLGMLWLSYGNALPLIAGAALGVAFKSIITEGLKLDQVLNQIAARGSESAASMDKVRDSVLELGKGVYAPLEVANAMETLVLAGLKAEQAISAIRPALNLATAGGVSIEKAAYTLVQVGTAMGYTSDSFSIVGDVIAKTAAMSMSSVESLSEAFKSASSVGVVFGVTLEDLGVQLAALSNLGIQGSAAGTAVKNFYKELDSDAKKVTGTLAKLGVSVERDLKVDGKFESIGVIVQKLSEAMDKAGDKGGKFLQAITNERGMRNMAALVQAYRKQVDETGTSFDKLREGIADSANFTAIAAANLAITSQAQAKGMLNSLKGAFAKTFEEMKPQFDLVVQEMKRAFNSKEFGNGLKVLATEFSNLIVGIIRHIPEILAVGKAFLAIKLGFIAGEVIMMAARGWTALAAAMALVQARALTMAVIMPPLAVAIGIAAAAYAVYNFNRKEALDTAPVEAAMGTNKEFIDQINKEAASLETANINLAKNNSLKTAAAQTSRQLAMEGLTIRNTEAVDSARKQYQSIYAETARTVTPMELANVKKFGEMGEEGIQKMSKDRIGPAVAAYANYSAALKNSVTSVRDLSSALDNLTVKRETNARLTEEKMAQEAKRAKDNADLAMKLAGDSDPLAPTATTNPQVTKIQNEILELNRLTAGYREKTEAVEQMGESGLRVMAKTQQARVEENNKVAGYYVGRQFMSAMLAAADADEAKFARDKAVAITENSNKVTEVLNRDIARKAAANIVDGEALGMMAKTTASIMLQNGATKEATNAAMERAKAADEVLRVEAATAKLVSATASSVQRAEGLRDEANAMLAYGRSAKQTAVELAEAEILKLKLAGTSSDVVIQHRREAAATEDLARAYNGLAKVNTDFQKRELDAAAYGVQGVIGAEAAKVVAHRDATNLIIQDNIRRAESALVAAKAGGNKTVIAKAQAEFNEVTALGKATSDKLNKYFKIDFKIANLKDVSSLLGEIGKTASKLGSSFAGIATAMDGMASALTDLAEAQRREEETGRDQTASRIGAYASMAGAAKNFFSEGTAGYRTLDGVAKMAHVAQLAMQAKEIGMLAIKAVMNQAGGDPYTAFSRMAAMAAVVATMGFAVGGGFNKGGGGKTAAEVQKEQGTGSVFGDSGAKSDSVGKSLALLEKNSNVMLPLTQGMLASLRSIESAMGGLTNLVARTDGVRDGGNFGIQTGVIKSGSSVLTSLGAALGGVGGALIGKIASLWGKTTQNVVDAGINFSGSVSSLQAGQGYSQYASVDTTKSSFFGLKKKTSNSMQTQGLSSELSSQFGLIFTTLEDTLKIAAVTLGKDTLTVTKAIDNLVIDSGVSLKGLAGKELQDAINGVVSKTMDQIAQAAFPSMDAFRQVGEGYAQTVIRVASGAEQATLALEQIGIKAVNYTAVLNKQGDVAVEIARQSIASVEGLSGINSMLQGMTGSLSELMDAYKELDNIRKQMNALKLDGNNLNVNVIKGAGGTTNLASALDVYKDKYFTDAEKSAIMLKSVTAEFAKLGKALPRSNAELRAMIEATGVSNEASSKLTGQLLSLTGAYAELTAAAEEARKDSIKALVSSIDDLKKFAQSIREFRESLLLGELSTLKPQEKFLEAKRQYEATLSKAMSGDAVAQANVTGQAQAFLEASRVVNASSADYTSSFDKVQKDMKVLESFVKAQITDAERQLALLESQVAGIDALNITAAAILAAIGAPTPSPIRQEIFTDGGGGVIVPAPSVPVAPVQDTSKEDTLKEILAALQASNVETAKQMQDLMGVVYDSNDKAAKVIVEGSDESAQKLSYMIEQSNTLVER